MFEAWFLLVQCGHWVQVAVQLLVTSEPEDCGPLLWLLTFYHHPTNQWHHRELQLVRISAKLKYFYLSIVFPSRSFFRFVSRVALEMEVLVGQSITFFFLNRNISTTIGWIDP